MTSSVDCNCKFSELTFSTPAISKATSKLFSSRAALMTKNVFIFPAFSTRFVDFAVQFCFRCKFSFHGGANTLRVFNWPSVPVRADKTHLCHWRNYDSFFSTYRCNSGSDRKML